MRKKIYDIIEVGKDNPGANRAYSVFMLCCIAASLIPLGFKETTPFLDLLDTFSVTVFIIDYLLGEDWYVVDPLGQTQINEIALYKILEKHSKRYRKECKGRK